jgi:parallel beta-helix repeat protein
MEAAMWKILASLCVSLVVTAISLPATLTVDLSGSADFTDLQSAIDAAADGDTVLVKPGEYVIAEPITFKGKAINVRSEAGSEATTIRMSETPADAARASVAVFEGGENAASVLEGFTLTGGQGTAVGDGSRVYGGGMCCGQDSSPTLTNCTITKNSDGGVSCEEGSHPSLTNCTISENSGGPWNGGGGLTCVFSSPKLTNCTITGNSGYSNPIWGNYLMYGGGLDCLASSVTLMNCTISGNSGPGVFCQGDTSTLTNCTISGNSGSGVECGTRCICFGCDCCAPSSPTLTNCTIWGNGGGSIVHSGWRCLSSVNVSFSCIEADGVWLGEGNIDRDPLFVQPGRWDDKGTPGDPSDDTWVPGDFRLQPGSPCIDAGTSEGASPSDIEGHPRPSCNGVDMGAHEFIDCEELVVFRRGDANADGATDLSDAVAALNHLFLGTRKVPCPEAADSNDDGDLDIADPAFLLSFLFLGGDAPHQPLESCGVDPTPDGLACESFKACR